MPSDTSKDYYFIHRDTGVTEPVLVEYGFLDSTGDDVNQLKNDYKKYAEAVVNAILEYKNINNSSSSDYYTVKSGDSLWRIAKNGVTVDELKNANNLTTNTLNIGQRLKIPGMAGTDGELKNYINYTVKAGDSLYKIASENNLTVQELKSYNNLSNDILQIGQTLRIPVEATGQFPSTNYTEYIVKSGDSLYSIGKQYGFTIQELLDYNNLDSALLSIGQIIKIPKSLTGSDQANYITYVVKPNDSLYSIGKQYDVSTQQLKDYNNLDSTLLSIGQILRIPISINNNQNNYIEYTVKSGDNLYTIGRKYGYTAQELMNYNNLKSNLLNIGQILRIPLSK